MEEELGAQRATGHNDYDTCSRCGLAFRREAQAVVESDALESHDTYETLCPDCQRALANGEIDLPLAPS